MTESEGKKTMSLKKAARKYNVALFTIVEFLMKNGIEVDLKPTTILSQEAIEILDREFITVETFLKKREEEEKKERKEKKRKNREFLKRKKLLADEAIRYWEFQNKHKLTDDEEKRYKELWNSLKLTDEELDEYIKLSKKKLDHNWPGREPGEFDVDTANMINKVLEERGISHRIIVTSKAIGQLGIKSVYSSYSLLELLYSIMRFLPRKGKPEDIFLCKNCSNLLVIVGWLRFFTCDVDQYYCLNCTKTYKYDQDNSGSRLKETESLDLFKGYSCNCIKTHHIP